MSKAIEKTTSSQNQPNNSCMSELTKSYRFQCHFLELIINDISSYSIIR